MTKKTTKQALFLYFFLFDLVEGVRAIIDNRSRTVHIEQKLLQISPSIDIFLLSFVIFLFIYNHAKSSLTNLLNNNQEQKQHVHDNINQVTMRI